MSKVLVERLNFYRTPDGKTLRYTESSPSDSCKSHMECGCTKNTEVRPEGEPDVIGQMCSIQFDGSEFLLSQSWMVFGPMGRPGHAYFHFRPDESSVALEISLPGYNTVDCFFAHLYMGEKIDTRRFMNGHSMSRVVDTRKIASDQLWLHECSWGGEAIRTLTSPVEMAHWKEVFRIFAAVHQAYLPYKADETSPVEDLRKRMEQDAWLLGNTEVLKDLLAIVVASLTTTQLFKLTNDIQAEINVQPSVGCG